MSERYGTIPKRFTKKWWEYFWDYYKVHTIVTLLVIIAVWVTVYQVMTAPRYDLYATYASSEHIGESSITMLTQKVSEFAGDLNEDEESLAQVQILVFSDKTENFDDAQLNAVMSSKLQLEFVSDENMLFVLSKEKADFLIDSVEDAGIFLEVSEWADDVAEDTALYKKGDKAYGVSLKGSKVLDECSIKDDNLYVMVRNYKTDDEDVIKRINASKKVAQKLIQ